MNYSVIFPKLIFQYLYTSITGFTRQVFLVSIGHYSDNVRQLYGKLYTCNYWSLYWRIIGKLENLKDRNFLVITYIVYVVCTHLYIYIFVFIYFTVYLNTWYYNNSYSWIYLLADYSYRYYLCGRIDNCHST